MSDELSMAGQILAERKVDLETKTINSKVFPPSVIWECVWGFKCVVANFVALAVPLLVPQFKISAKVHVRHDKTGGAKRCAKLTCFDINVSDGIKCIQGLNCNSTARNMAIC